VDGAAASACRDDRRWNASSKDAPSMEQITTFGIGLAKNIFQGHTIDAAG
jgi:hypothetical protein